MKLASLKHGRDGRLVVVSRDLSRYADAAAVAPTLLAALDDWAAAEPRLTEIADSLEAGRIVHAPFDQTKCASPLPRSPGWADGSAYVNHVALVRRARGAELPASFWTDPLMYRGGSDGFIAPRDPIQIGDTAWGVDLEAEVGVIVGDVPTGASASAAAAAIRLIVILNDVSFRNLIPGELAKGFGFLQGKGQTAFSPVAVTPDELGPAWDGAKLVLPLLSTLNGAARLRHGIEPRRRRRAGQTDRRGRCRLFVHRRTSLGRDHPAWRAEDAVPQLRRPRPHRDERPPRPLDLRRDRAGRDSFRMRPAFAAPSS